MSTALCLYGPKPEGQQLAVAAPAAAQPQEAVGQDAVLEQGV